MLCPTDICGSGGKKVTMTAVVLPPYELLQDATVISGIELTRHADMNTFTCDQSKKPRGQYHRQKTADDMIRGMTPTVMTNAQVARELNRWQEAINYIRIQDAARVRRFTDLRSPFTA
jgi:hypothetical protein